MNRRYLIGSLAIAGIAGGIVLAQNAPAPQQPMSFFVTSAGPERARIWAELPAPMRSASVWVQPRVVAARPGMPI